MHAHYSITGGKRAALQLEASIHVGVTCFVDGDSACTTWAIMVIMHRDRWALRLCSMQSRSCLGCESGHYAHSRTVVSQDLITSTTVHDPTSLILISQVRSLGNMRPVLLLVGKTNNELPATVVCTALHVNTPNNPHENRGIR